MIRVLGFPGLVLCILAIASTGLGQRPETHLVPVPKAYLASASVRMIRPQTTPFQQVSASSLPDSLRLAAMETVKVRAGRGEVSYGSGIHIGGGYILSCYHTIRGTQVGTQAVQWPGGDWVRAEVVARDPRADLSLKRVAIPSIPAGRAGVEIAIRYPRQGESLWLVGYPHGERLSFWSGHATGANYQSAFGIDRWVIPGYSGGPAFDSESRVIGINVMSDYADRRSETISVSPAAINDLLRPFGAAIVAARQIQCGGGCAPHKPYPPAGGGYSGGNGGYGQQVPITPAIPQATPVEPKLNPPAGGQQYVMPVTPLDLESLRDEIIAEVLAQIPRARDGLNGKDGQRGPPGPPAQFTQTQIAQIVSIVVARLPQQPTIAEIADAVATRLPPIYPMWVDSQGNTIDEIPGGVRLGQTMPLRIDSIVREARNANTGSQ